MCRSNRLNCVDNPYFTTVRIGLRFPGTRLHLSLKAFTGSKVYRFAFNANLNRRYVKPELFLKLWVENQIHATTGVIHTQNGGIILLRDPRRLMDSLRFQQKSNAEPLNPEPAYSNCFWDRILLYSRADV